MPGQCRRCFGCEPTKFGCRDVPDRQRRFAPMARRCDVGYCGSMKPFFPTRPVLLLLAAALTGAPGCGRQTRTQTDEISARDATRFPSEPTSRFPTETRVSTGATEQRRADLLNRIRAADPQQATIQRALINERNELGLVLNRQTNLDDVPKLMKSMLAELDKAFPGQDHTVVAYTPTNPPRTIGTARLNARTRDMTYTPASP
jgi:hypothetical protein